MKELSVMIVKDGEGATKLINIIVEKAKTDADAKKLPCRSPTPVL